MTRDFVSKGALVLLAVLLPRFAVSSPLAPPGDLLLRHDLKLLTDTGILQMSSASTWPVSWRDVRASLGEVDCSELDTAVRSACDRLQNQTRSMLAEGDGNFRVTAAASHQPRVIRTFEDTPREDAEAGVTLDWSDGRFAMKLSATVFDDSSDSTELRPDDTYLGVALGNWMVTAGWQLRWWGPGNDGSLILSSNARPRPGLSLQRILSTPFDNRWLGWLGPWSVTTFVEQLDDDRVVNNALLWGLRVDVRPLPGLEIGLSRTAQWCGDDRPCGLDTFFDVLTGNDNRGVNVDPEDEPGNQLAGFDMRWSLAQTVPLALYVQWIGEDTRRGGPEIGSWLRLAGGETWGRMGDWSYRTHVEWAETICRQGSLGFNDIEPDCAYRHSIYGTGYRYEERSLGHGMDGDGEAYSLGLLLVQSAGHTWNLALRSMDINRVGTAGASHSLSASPQERFDAQITHARMTQYGRIHIGIGYSRVDSSTAAETADVTGFLRWSSR